MRVLTWNLFHGRAVPDRPRSLLPEFRDLIASWEWDVALLQEVPPWWPEPLARAAHASERMALTSRNELLPLRRLLAQWRPDVMKSAGGGSNAILVRGERILEHRRELLRRLPERRVAHGVRLASGLWVANVHAQVRPHELTRADLARAGAAVRAWAGDGPAVLGGDCNVPDPRIDGFADAGGHGVDHVLVRGLAAAGKPRTLDRHGLSDHAPVLVEVA
ncbi:MAG: endonuclease/exonuclease/phosphatase family protein [Solirubrobacterales bacterium]|nr:endonuclease/exonuclease/phosphatase family protein [Solirubrobacterales bacterium]